MVLWFSVLVRLLGLEHCQGIQGKPQKTLCKGPLPHTFKPAVSVP